MPTDARFLAHHRVLRNGSRWWVDGIEIFYEEDALALPFLAPGRTAA